MLKKRAASDRMLDELPWQLSRAKEWPRLTELVSNLPFFKEAWDSNQFEVMRYWAQVETESRFRMADAYRPVLQQPAQHHRFVLEISLLLEHTGHLDEAIALQQYLIKHYKQKGAPKDLASAMNNCARMLAQRGDLKEALALYQRSGKLFQKLGDSANVAASLGNQGIVLLQLGDPDGAWNLLKQWQQSCRDQRDVEVRQSS
jgi:tetratricopeptide (TPR) repeat protein